MEDFKYDVQPQMRIALQEIGSADLTAQWLCGNFEMCNTSVNEREEIAVVTAEAVWKL